eukprot:6458298-Amphidinium_carterae.2
MSLPEAAGQVPLSWPLVPREVQSVLEAPDEGSHSHAPALLPGSCWLRHQLGQCQQRTPKTSFLQDACQRRGSHPLWAAVVVAPAMGDQKAPEVAQLAHAHLLSEFKVFQSKHMVYGEPVPVTNLWQSVGAYATPEARKCESQALGNMYKSYSTTGLVRKASKAVTKASTTEVWGVELNDSSKTVGVSAPKRHLLVLATARLVSRRSVNPMLVQKIIGHWCYVLLMCLLQYTYSWLRHPSVAG